MKYIEKLGISNELEKLSDYILSRFKKETKFSFETDVFGRNILINCEYNKTLMNDVNNPILAGIRPFYDENYICNIFDFYTTTLDRPTILHEVKHIHRFVKNKKERSYMTHAGRKTAKDYKHYFYSNDSYLLFHDMVYYCSQTEFESYYTEIYYELEEIFKRNNYNKEEKREIIKKYLKDTTIYEYYEYFYSNKFELKNYFDSSIDMNNFLELLKNNIIHYKNINTERMNSKKMDIFLSKIKKFLRIDTNFVSSSKLEKEINNKINKMVNIGFKKFQRLYTHFL